MNNISPSMCSVSRNEETFRRLFALMSWILKVITMIVFFATIRLCNRQGQRQEEGDQPQPTEPNVPRHRRVAYRHVTQSPTNGSSDD